MTLRKVAEARGCTVQQVALAFNLTRGVVVIPKSSRASNIKSNLAASGLVLSSDEMRLLGGCDKGKRRFPDIIGIWPASAPLAARILGLFLRTICTFLFSLPLVRLDVCELARKKALLNEARDRGGVSEQTDARELRERASES